MFYEFKIKKQRTILYDMRNFRYLKVARIFEEINQPSMGDLVKITLATATFHNISWYPFYKYLKDPVLCKMKFDKLHSDSLTSFPNYFAPHYEIHKCVD